MCKKFQIAEEFKTLIGREDILWVDEFLAYLETTESDFVKVKGKVELTHITAYLENRRFLRMKKLEKLLINGEATATQVRCYETLVNGKSNDDVQQSSDDVLKLYNDIYGDNSST